MAAKISARWQQSPIFIYCFTSSFVGTENYFKNTLALTLGNKNGLKDCKVMLWSATYPEICLKGEISASAKTLRMYSDRLKKMKASRVTSDLGCQFKVIWEFQLEFYSPFGCIDDKERGAHLCKKLQELQKSEAVFKDSVVDIIDILMRGFGTMEASHHNSILKVDLGCSNAQCQCFECLEAQYSSIPLYSREDMNYHSNLFTFVDENTQFPWTILNWNFNQNGCFLRNIRIIHHAQNFNSARTRWHSK